MQFTHLTSEEGLSSSTIMCIFQDHKGFMWIGTNDGLNRYDGLNFVVYRNNHNDSTSLANNTIWTIFEDHDKNLFIGTENGLCLYDRDKDHFLNYVTDKSSPLEGVVCRAADVAEDSLGNFWMATSVGLIYFDRINNKIKQFTHDPDNPESLSDNNVGAILLDEKNRLWIATNTGLNIFLPESGTFNCFARDVTDADDLSKLSFFDITEDHEGNIWFGSEEGLFCLAVGKEVNTTNLIHYKHDDQDKNSLSANRVYSLCVDQIGNLWAGTENGGINLFDRKNKRFWHYRKDDYDPQGLNNETIRCIFQDRTENLWFGTFTGGLNISMRNGDAVVKYQNLPGVPSSLCSYTVTCFLEDHSGLIWVGTDGGGINLFDKQNNQFLHFNMDNSGISSNCILCSVEDSDNNIWFGTWGGGLILYNHSNKSFKSFTTKNSGITDDNIFAIAEGYKDDLWLGTLGHGLIHFQTKSKKITEYNTNNSGLVNKMVNKLAFDTKGRLLIGSPECFQIFYPEENKFVTYRNDPDNERSLSFPRITDILSENDTCIWIGTPNGLNMLNPNTGSFKRFYEKDGLPDNYIKGLITDDSGILWVSSNKGVCRFNNKNGEIRNLTKNDGLQGNEFYDRSILKTKSGDLLMGGTKGFNIINPAKLIENIVIPEVIITGLKIFNKNVKPGDVKSPLVHNISETKVLTLPYYLTVLTFSFAVMDFSAPEKNQYAYMMENFDREWINSGNKGEATYTNLDPGEYVFRVKGSNSNSFWNETGTSIKIVILPPWWSTWWFRLILIVVLVLIITAIFIFRLENLRSQKILLEKTVAIKTAELNELYASKDKLFSIIGHDLKNPFNTIIGFSDILKEEIRTGDPEKNEEYAGFINTSAVQTLRLLENILDWANSQTGKIKVVPVNLDLKEILNEELSLLKEMANGKNIELKNSVSDNLMITADRNMIKTILRNLISNAVKFTPKNGKVEITATSDDKDVEISVSDTGIGMTKDTIGKLFRVDANLSTRGTENESGSGLGLFLCKEFVEKNGGKIWVESESGKGSNFKFSIPMNPGITNHEYYCS